MPLHDDEMNRRRERREAQRRKQRAQARRMRLRLILAALLLILGGVAIYRLMPENGAEKTPVVKETAPVQTAAPTSPAQKDPITTIHIRAGGDLNVTDAVVNAGISINGYDFTSAFKDVTAVLSEADLTVLNFEGNVCGEPYGTETTSAPIELIQGLRNAGVDMLQVANSCIINNGLNGLTTTLQAIRSAGIEPVGAFASTEEFRRSKGYTMTEIQGVKVAFVSFTKGMNGRGLPAGSEDLVNLLYTDYALTYQTIDKKRIESILKDVEAERPDITIALLHWGSEYNDDISSTQKSIISLMQRRGVDVIIGTHPHLVQPIVYDEAAGTLVAYSLGDFFGDASRGGTNYSIILDIEITKDDNAGTTRVTDYSYIPIYTVKSTECAGNYSYSRVMRIETALSAYQGNFLDKITTSCQESMTTSLERIASRVVMEEETKK